MNLDQATCTECSLPDQLRGLSNQLYKKGTRMAAFGCELYVMGNGPIISVLSIVNKSELAATTQVKKYDTK